MWSFGDQQLGMTQQPTDAADAYLAEINGVCWVVGLVYTPYGEGEAAQQVRKNCASSHLFTRLVR